MTAYLFELHRGRRGALREPSLALEGVVAQGTGEKVSLLGAVDGDTFVVSSTVQG